MDLAKITVDQPPANDFIELSICLCVYEIFYTSWDSYETDKERDHSIEELAELADVSIDEDAVIKSAEEERRTLDVFHAPKAPGNFIVFDHFADPTDQNAMVTLGVRIRKKDFDTAFSVFMRLYLKSGPRCNLQIDYWNRQYFSRVFNSAASRKWNKAFKGYTVSHYGLEGNEYLIWGLE